MSNVYIICPVRNLSNEWREGLLAYAHNLERQGHKVHLPFRDTEQNDTTGFYICQDHAMKMMDADEVHIAYDGKSEGWLFDLGMAFIMNKPLTPITGYFPNVSRGKSYPNMVWQWNAIHYNY